MNYYAQRNQMALEFFKNSCAVVLKNKVNASFYFFGFFNFSGQKSSRFPVAIQTGIPLVNADGFT